MAVLERFEYTQVHMGVQARLVLYAVDTISATTAARAAFDRLAELDAVMSDYRIDSELNRLAESGAGRAVPLSADLYHVLDVAQQLARSSEGAFDVTMGPVVQLWREARRSGRLPSSEDRERALRHSGYHLLQLDPVDSTATLSIDEMRLDLGGIAKGYAADEMIATLRKHGVTRTLIELGGEIAVGDPPPNRGGWDVAVPLAGRTYQLRNQAIATSGDTEQFVELGGTRYSHVVNPRTGIGLTHRIAVTVVAPCAILSDALSTTLSVLGAEQAESVLAGYSDVHVTTRYLEN